MGEKNKLTNKQTVGMGMHREDNGKNMHEEKKRNQSKNDNVKPR